MGDGLGADEAMDIDPGDMRWVPPEGVTRHSGDPIEPGSDFFVEPPPEIGELVSAETTLRAGKRPWRGPSRIALAGLFGWGVYMVGEVLMPQFQPDDPTLYRMLTGTLALFLALLAWFVTRFSHTCSFVGKNGLARAKCVGSRDRLRPTELFLFEDAADLRTSQTRMYHNGIYTGTSYAFHWTDLEGRKVYKLSGTYRGEKKPPKAKDPFHFAGMAEGAWSAFLFNQILPTLEAGRAVRFNLSGKNFVAIGPGFLDIATSGLAERLEAHEIGGIQVDSGLVKIKRVDAQEGWFSSKGVHKFSYDQMANSRVFLLLYAHLIAGRAAPAPRDAGAEVAGAEDEL